PTSWSISSVGPLRLTARCFYICRFLAPIEIALQNHLSRYLIDIAASGARFLSRFSQRPVGRHSRQPLIPCDDRAGQICPELFYEVKCFNRGSTDRAFHLARNSHHDMIYLSFANNLT